MKGQGTNLMKILKTNLSSKGMDPTLLGKPYIYNIYYIMIYILLLLFYYYYTYILLYIYNIIYILYIYIICVL